MNKKLVTGLIIVAVLAVLGFIIFRPNNRSKTADAAIMYDYVQVQRMDLGDTVDATGTVVLSENSDIYPAYAATVKQIMCKAGDSVSKGQPLMVLDSPQLAEAWSDASSSLNQAKINLDQAERELKRVKALYAIQGATTVELDDAQGKADIAREQLQVAQLKVNNLQQKPDDANYFDPKSNKLMIRAPFNGKVGWIESKVGDPVDTTTLILSITSDKGIEIQADIDESEIGMVKLGQPVEVTSSDSSENMQGVVVAVGNIGKDSSGSNSGSSSSSGVVNFPVKVKVMKSNSALRPGMSVDITILANQHPNVLAVPIGAVTERRGKKMVALPGKDNKGVTYVRVEVGVQTGNFAEIISGLQEGQTVAVPQLKVNSGQGQQRNGGGMGMRFGG